jgi:2,4-dienoyl-CoA reductase-like NADH-dependent reductase (Old Yellow Enzyme family)/thioredoxin reductase
MEFKKLFTPIKIKNMELRNRIVMLPMSTTFVEPDGTVGDRFIDFFAARAKGGAGLINIPFTPINDGSPVEPGLFDDRFLPGIRRLTSRIHSYGAKTAAQLIITYFIDFQGGAPEVVAPSPIFNKMLHCVPRELTTDEIHLITAGYGHAASLARQGGFDAVEVLVAAGYLLNRFLSPLGNERRDAYGGSLENRIRIIVEVIESIKKEAGEDFPIICRLNVEEQMPGGLTIEDSREIVKILEKSGVDMINTYTGWHESPIPTVAPSLPKGAFAHLSAKIKEYVDLPVIAANRINDPFTAEKILAEGKADLIGMARALLADPELPNKAHNGRTDEIVPCLGCSECLAQLLVDSYGKDPAGPVRSFCSVNPLAGKEAQSLLSPANPAKKVFVAGSGPGGMVAAMTAAARGHAVTLFEKGSEPGGRLLSAALPPFKEEIRNLIKSLYVRALKAGVNFQFNTDVDPQLLEKEKPDVLVLATGAEAIIPPIAGIDGPNVLLAEDILKGRKTSQGAAIVIGGGMVGCETAEFLLAQGATDVTVVEMMGRMADNVVPTYRPFFLGRLKKEGVKFATNTTVTGITDRGVNTRTKEGAGFLPGETVILAAGFKADPRKTEMFRATAGEIISVGDCVRARLIKDAVEEGFAAGKSV